MKRTHTIQKKNKQHNQVWEWEETPAVKKALELLEKSSKEVESKSV